MRTVAGPGGDRIIPGAASIAEALATVADGGDVDYDGGGTSLDWDDFGVVSSGAIGIWQYQDGEIVELETVQFPLE